jgi:hypothetical protein
MSHLKKQLKYNETRTVKNKQKIWKDNFKEVEVA